MKQRRIYLDNNASAPLHPRVITAMMDEMEQLPGNPSSIHLFGQQAHGRMLVARDTIADFMGARPQEILFTSGSTEANNTLIQGFFRRQTGGHVISSDVEHSSIYRPLQWLEKTGQAKVTILPAGEWGIVKPEAVAEAISEDTRLIVLSSVNNETGVMLDLEAIAKIAYEASIPLIVDGVAMIGKEPITVYPGISAMTFSGHKFHAPKGVGFSFVRRSFKFDPLIMGGHHEYNRRAGTENVLGIVAMAEAIRVLQDEAPTSFQKMRSLLELFENGVLSTIEGVSINGKGPRTISTVNFTFKGIDGESLLTSLDLEGVSASHGSACSAGSLQPSRVLLNMGLSPKEARASLRFSLSSMTTKEEIEAAIPILQHVTTRLRTIIETSSA